MPVRSSTSSVLKWPDAVQVRTALTEWARARGRTNPDIQRVGYFGSYARGTWGPGSDLDVVIVVGRSGRTFVERGVDWDLTTLPVPAESLTYTADEWRHLSDRGGRFAKTLEDQTVWVYERDG
jgi:hypothetical protein